MPTTIASMVVAVVAFLLGLIPPLSPGQLEQLASAYDGRDHRESAFDALLEHVDQWSEESTQAITTAPKPDTTRLRDDPQHFRGDLIGVTGLLAQRSRLGPPHESVEQWFVRTADREPILVFVSRLPAGHRFREGDRISIATRFYKRIDTRARDGVVHAYPAFVGAFPVLGSTVVAADDRSWLITLVVLLFGVFLVTLVIARRRRTPRRRVLLEGFPSPPLEPESSLPDDPAEALATLHRRAAGDRDPDEPEREES